MVSPWILSHLGQGKGLKTTHSNTLHSLICSGAMRRSLCAINCGHRCDVKPNTFSKPRARFKPQERKEGPPLAARNPPPQGATGAISPPLCRRHCSSFAPPPPAEILLCHLTCPLALSPAFCSKPLAPSPALSLPAVTSGSRRRTAGQATCHPPKIDQRSKTLSRSLRTLRSLQRV